MSLNWKMVTADHVRHACASLAAHSNFRLKKHGLVVYEQNHILPAKDVLRESYRLASGLPEGVEIKFSSGSGTLNILRKLGFRAERLDE